MRTLSTSLLALVLVGCFDAHGVDPDAGPDTGPDPDAGLWTDCHDALWARAPEGAPCDFDETCESFDMCGPASEALMCIGGRLRWISRTCSRVLWSSCEHYLSAWGSPGDGCDPTTFEACRVAEDACCWREIACDGSESVTDDVICTRGPVSSLV